MPSTHQSSRKPSDHSVCTRRAICLIGRGLNTGHTLITGSCSSRTIRRRLAKEHLGLRRPLRMLPLTPTHLRLHLEWCHARGNRTAANGTKSSLVTRESRFNLSIDDNRVRVWRPRGEHLNPALALQQHTSSPAGVMVSINIAYNTRSPLVLIHGTMTAQWYVHDILQPHVLPLMQRLPGALFQQDHARTHTARVFQDFLRTTTTLPWPARPPYLSPIEHIWDDLGRRVGHPPSLNELEAWLQQIWNEMSQDIVQNLYASMPDRIASCIRALEGVQQGIKSSVL
ncbi:transposable element Tcb2 transposase [Trichonephila clavipes]|nr:transposable element Tcb2 transposase [Trichonephila clavipes]